jgi:ligand-binding SRPBCC domain-containing protein
MRMHTMETTVFVPRRRSDVFPFFADAANLEAMTPPWLNFSILTRPPIRMEVGALIDYRIRLHGVPLPWRTRITAWDPPARFVDEQIRGPYRAWIHEHTFTERDGGTEVRDFVRYAVPGGELVHRFFVRRDVERIFEYRRERLLGVFGGGAPPGEGARDADRV